MSGVCSLREANYCSNPFDFFLFSVDINKDVDEDEDIQDEATKEVFSSTETTTDVNSHATRIIFPEEKTENDCIRTGCRHVAIKSPEWDDEYCSNECAVGHCKDVFAAWQAEQRV